MSEPRLEVTGATVRFGATTALADVDLAVPAGEVVAILGPSGSGKSTLLRAIAGLQHLDQGAVHLDGRDLAAVPPHRRGIGLMFQDQALFPHRDVAANVAFGLRMQGRDRRAIEARVTELLGLVGLGGMEHRAVQQLSGGEQQRVALARALAPEPRVLLLDEPLGALDRTLRERLVAELRQLFSDLGATVLTVTHDQAEAFALADRLVVMDGGRVLRRGTPSEVWREPRRAAVAELLGFPNVVEAAVVDGTAHTPWGAVPLDGAPDGPARLVVRASGVHLDGGGTPATVTSRSFAGATTTIRLDVGAAPPLQAEVPTATAPAVGAAVAFRIDPDAIALLEP